MREMTELPGEKLHVQSRNKQNSGNIRSHSVGNELRTLAMCVDLFWL